MDLCKEVDHRFRMEHDANDLCGLWQTLTGRHDALFIALSHAIRVWSFVLWRVVCLFDYRVV